LLTEDAKVCVDYPTLWALSGPIFVLLNFITFVPILFYTVPRFFVDDFHSLCPEDAQVCVNRINARVVN